MSSPLSRLLFPLICLALGVAVLAWTQGAPLIAAGSGIVIFALSAIQVWRDPYDAAAPLLFVGVLALVLAAVWKFYEVEARSLPDPRLYRLAASAGLSATTGLSAYLFGRTRKRQVDPLHALFPPDEIHEREGVRFVVIAPESVSRPQFGWLAFFFYNPWTSARAVEVRFQSSAESHAVTLKGLESGFIVCPAQGVLAPGQGVRVTLRVRVKGLWGRRVQFQRGRTSGNALPSLRVGLNALSIAGGAVGLGAGLAAASMQDLLVAVIRMSPETPDSAAIPPRPVLQPLPADAQALESVLSNLRISA